MDGDGLDVDLSMHATFLPSRAFLQSWLDQTVPARRAALDEAVELHGEAVKEGNQALADMALLGVIGDAMQALEDLAFLATAWDSPFAGVAHYVRATTYTPQTAQSFWQEVKLSRRWDDTRIEVFAGLSVRDPATTEAQRTTDLTTAGSDRDWSKADRDLFDEIASITVAKLRRLLSGLSDDWMQFLPYFQSFKHGGLAVNRDDTFFVDDDVEEVDESTPRAHPCICVWTRGGRKQELVADFAATPEQVVRIASSAGRLALNMIEVFVEMRLWVFDTVELGDDGRIAGWKSVQIPITYWLREEDLPVEKWQRIGRGPRMLIAADNDDHASGGGDAPG